MFYLFMNINGFLDFRLDNYQLLFNYSLNFLLSFDCICLDYLRSLYFFCLCLYFRLLRSLQTISSYRTYILNSCIPHLQALSLNPIKDGPDNRLRIKPMNLLVKLPVSIMNGSIGKGRTSNILHAMLRIRRAIEIVYLEAPFLLMFQLIHHLLEEATKTTMRREILDYLKGCFIIEDQLLKLLCVDQVRVRLVPLLSM